MVNSRELKIDNLLLEQGEVCKVYKLYKDRFSVWTKRGRRNGILCYPIELTPEILEMCGFGNLHAEHSVHFKKDNILIEIIPDGTIHARLEYGTQSLFLTELKSLHQLQNLYFALTNQELYVSKLTNN